ncbi:hypothetical protein BDZ89DRAFT_937347, partial [Hymenopellis radicata]
GYGPNVECTTVTNVSSQRLNCLRGFLRHPTVLQYVKDRIPNNPLATLADVHVSLANRSHLRGYIKGFKNKTFPKGTGWEG